MSRPGDEEPGTALQEVGFLLLRFISRLRVGAMQGPNHFGVNYFIV